jgi:hypothetical protein
VLLGFSSACCVLVLQRLVASWWPLAEVKSCHRRPAAGYVFVPCDAGS